MSHRLDEVIAALADLDHHPTARELADALWLARFLPPGEATARTAGETPHEERPRDTPPDRDSADSPATEPAEPRAASHPGAASPQAGLHIGPSASEPEERVRSPAVPAIPRSLELARALRPLRESASSTTAESLVEEATAQLIAETGIWQPVLEPAAERCFDLALIVDAGASMVVWSRVAAELHTLLEQLGAFRDVRTWRLNTDDDVLVLKAEGGSDRNPKELIDPTRRRIVLIFSDCIGLAWSDGRAGGMLEHWAEAGPVAIVQPLPQRLWWRCGAPVEPVRLRSDHAGSPNRRLHVRSADGFGTPPGAAIPVLELGARWLRPWAELVCGGARRMNAMAMFTGAAPLKAPADDAWDEPSAHERVMRFRATASPKAFQLAARLAAAPLRLQVMSLVQRAVLPESSQTHLAEVFLGGLMRRTDRAGPDAVPEEVLYDFHEGVRDVLLSGMERGEVLYVLRQVWEVVRERLGSPHDFPALLRAIDQGTETLQNDLPFAHVAANVLRRLGGHYAQVAERLPEAGPGDAGMSEDGRLAEVPSASRPLLPRSGPVLGGGLPARNPGFIGRDELLRTVRERLADTVITLLPAPPHELGGQGKSQLAVEYAHRHAGDYDLIWWVPAEQVTLARSSLAELAERVGCPRSDDISRTVEQLFEVLRNEPPYRRWLLIYDNATDPDELLPLMPVRPQRPGGSSGAVVSASTSGHVLVTSRDRRWAGRTAATEVGFFERPESVELLCRRVPGLAPAEADRVAGRVGDLPLAVEQAAAWHAATGRASEEYLRLLDRKLAKDLHLALPQNYPAELPAVLEVSFDRLREESSMAGGLLEVLAFFGPEPVALAMLSAGAFAAQLAPDLRTTLRDSTALRQAMTDIDRYALGRFDSDSESFQVHRLMRTMLQQRLSETERGAARRQVHHILAAATPDVPPDDQTTWTLRAQIAPHVAPTGVIHGETAEIREIALDQMSYLYLLGDFESSRALAEKALDHWRTVWTPDDISVLGAGRELGIALRALGDVAAASRLNREVYDLALARFGPDHGETLSIATSRAADLRLRGEFESALGLDSDTLLRRRRLLGVDHSATVSSINSVGIDLRLLGEFERARKNDAAALGRLEQGAGRTHRSTLLAMSQLARDLHGLGRYREASQRQREALEHMRRTLSPDHAFVLHAEMSRAAALHRLGDYPESRRLAERTLQRHLNRFGEDHQDTLAAQRVLAMVYVRTDDADRALDLIEAALTGYRRVMGTDHPFVHACATDRAHILRALGGHGPARASDDTSLAALVRLLGHDHYYSLCCSVGLVHDLYHLGRLDAAHSRSTETKARFEAGYGPNHPYTLACVHNHRVIKRALGLDDSGGNPLNALQRILGEDHPEIREALEGRLLECAIEPIPL